MAEANGDLDLVRNACLLRTRSAFGLMSLAANIGVNAGLLERFLAKGEPLPDSAMISLVDTVFHGKAAWNQEAGAIVDVVKAPSPMMDMRPAAATTAG
jgi:hypothetical protein